MVSAKNLGLDINDHKNAAKMFDIAVSAFTSIGKKEAKGITVVSNEQKHSDLKRARSLRMTLPTLIKLKAEFHNTTVDIEAAFKKFDADGDGDCTLDEFRAAVAEMSVDISSSEMDAMLGHLDSDHDGKVSLAEFMREFSGDMSLKVESGAANSKVG